MALSPLCIHQNIPQILPWQSMLDRNKKEKRSGGRKEASNAMKENLKVHNMHLEYFEE